MPNRRFSKIDLQKSVVVAGMGPKGWETQPLRRTKRLCTFLDYLLTMKCQQNLVHFYAHVVLLKLKKEFTISLCYPSKLALAILSPESYNSNPNVPIASLGF